MRRMFILLVLVFFMSIFTVSAVSASQTITTTYVTTYIMSSATLTTTITTTTVLDNETTTTVSPGSTSTSGDVYKSLYTAMLRISYLEEVTNKQKSSISSLLAENSSLRSQNSVYITTISNLLASVNSMSTELSSLSYENAMLSAQLSYYKENYEKLYTAVAVNFNELNNATSFYQSVNDKAAQAKRERTAAVIAIIGAVIVSAYLYSRYIKYKTLKAKKKRLF